ncbi:MAG: restriction endonuclease subunit S [Nitrospira sp.]|nr:restriction endonuclease subunit S [Nitrospira sp.]
MTYKEAEIGEVPEKWEVTELVTYLGRITYGFTNPMPDTDKGPWKVTAKDIVNGYINYQTARHTTQDAFDNELTDKSKPRIGDVLLTKDGSIGRVAVVDQDGICINQSVALLRPNDRILSFFLKYLLLAPHYQRVMERDSDGSTIKHIYITRVDKMQVAVPPIDEQKGILSVVKTLDDKIELNRRMNETLDAIARAIFRSWFVDFDPVRAKVSGEPSETICRRLGLTPDFLALFPSRFQDSQVGEIPEGWAVGTADEYCFLNAKSWTQTSIPDVVHYVDLASAKNGVILDVQSASSRTAPSRARRILRPGDTIIGTVRPGNRSFALIGEADPSLTGSTGFAVLSPKRLELRELVYFLATSDENIERLTRLADGAAYPAVRPEVVTAGVCVIPDPGIIDAFHKATASMIDLQLSNRINNCTLAATRDALLPRLLSGTLRVPITGAA